MKQSTKLLSLVLALVMAFSCMTVIGNAVLVKSAIVYDSIDDAALTLVLVKLHKSNCKGIYLYFSLVLVRFLKTTNS